MNEPKSLSTRGRLQALLAVPERERTDAQWDELNELEIMLASGNRDGAEQRRPQNFSTTAARPKHTGKPQVNNSGKKFHRRPPKSNPS